MKPKKLNQINNNDIITKALVKQNTGGYEESVIYGSSTNGEFGWSVSSAGDINGDGIDDVVIGAWHASPKNIDIAGVAYVIYGNKQGVPDITSIEDYLNDISKGFKIYGSNQYNGLGSAVSKSGDINGDGIDDIIVGALGASPLGRDGVGATYIIYGSKGTLPNIVSVEDYLNDTSKGFKIYGTMHGLGIGASQMRDINNDGYNDLVIGAYAASPFGKIGAGAAYVIYGKRGNFDEIPSIEYYLNNTSNGFEIYGSSAGDMLGMLVSGIGDINADGINDVIVGASIEGTSPDKSRPGAVYIIYGKQQEIPNILSVESYLKDLNKGFKAYGSYPGDRFGRFLSDAGDINGDGIDDIIIGAPDASPEEKQHAGAAYVIYGSSKELPHIYDIENYLNDISKGFKIYGASAGNGLGHGISKAGDINGDGNDDIIVSAPGPSVAYVIYGAGRGLPNIVSIEDYVNDTSKGFKIYSASTGDGLGVSAYNIGDINGDGGNDIIVGAFLASPEGRKNAGAAYIIYGKPSQNAQHQQNYGMISQINYFISMSYQSIVGKIAIGETGKWCNANSLYVGDFNGDGKSDLLCNLAGGANYIMLSEGMTADGVQFAAVSVDKNGRVNIGENGNWCDNSYQRFLIGDFNADGKSDLLCNNNGNKDQGQNYIMLSTGNGFVSIGKSPDGAVSIGTLGTFCATLGRLVVGNFDGIFGDDLLCNHPTGGNMLMISYKDDVGNIGFKSVNTDPVGLITMGNDGGCLNVWCEDIANTRLLVGNFDGDKKTDLLCNANDRSGDGRNLIMLSRAPKDPNSPNCDFNSIPTEDGTKPDGYIAIGKGLWCSSSQMLKTGDINGDGKNDLLCNVLGINKIMLCVSDDTQKSQYYFKSFNASAPAGDDGTTCIATQRVWCTAQHIVMGDYDGETFNNNTICDLLCNQESDVLGANSIVLEEI